MKTLVLVEHDNVEVAAATLSTVKAASSLGQILIFLLPQTLRMSYKASKIEGVSKVLSFVDERFGNEIAEDVAECVVQVANDYNFFLASSSTTGKNNLPRFAALLDIQQISEVIEIIDNTTFKNQFMLELVLRRLRPIKKKMFFR